MSIKSFILFSAVAIGALAAPGGPPNGPPGGYPGGRCLTDADAKQIGNNWVQIIGNFTTTLADAALAPNFTDYSASALSLNSNCQQAPGTAPPITEPVFTSRDQFIMGQGPQAPIASTILGIWHDCSTVTMRYRMTNIGSAKRPVTAIIVMDTVKAPAKNAYPYQIKTTYSEFDSAAWVSNLKDVNNCKTPTTS